MGFIDTHVCLSIFYIYVYMGGATVAVGYYLSGSPTHLLFKSGMDPVQLLLPPVNVENRALPCYLSTRCPKTLPCYPSTYTVRKEKGVSGDVRTAAAVRYRLALLQPKPYYTSPFFSCLNSFRCPAGAVIWPVVLSLTSEGLQITDFFESPNEH